MDKVLNPLTNRFIKVNSRTHKILIRSGVLTAVNPVMEITIPEEHSIEFDINEDLDEHKEEPVVTPVVTPVAKPVVEDTDEELRALLLETMSWDSDEQDGVYILESDSDSDEDVYNISKQQLP